MPAPLHLTEKTPDLIRADLAGFPAAAVDAALRFREDGAPGSLEAMVLGMLAYYRPSNRTEPLDAMPPETRFREELGIDSLTLAEMVFKLDELLGVPIEMHEVAQVQTLGELQTFLRQKLGS